MSQENRVVRRVPQTSLVQQVGLGFPLGTLPPGDMRELGDVANINKLVEVQGNIVEQWLARCSKEKIFRMSVEASVGGFIFKRSVFASIRVEKW